MDLKILYKLRQNIIYKEGVFYFGILKIPHRFSTINEEKIIKLIQSLTNDYVPLAPLFSLADNTDEVVEIKILIQIFMKYIQLEMYETEYEVEIIPKNISVYNISKATSLQNSTSLDESKYIITKSTAGYSFDSLSSSAEIVFKKWPNVEDSLIQNLLKSFHFDNVEARAYSNFADQLFLSKMKDLKPYLEKNLLVQKNYTYCNSKEDLINIRQREGIPSTELDRIFANRKSRYQPLSQLCIKDINEILDSVFRTYESDSLSYPSAGGLYEIELYIAINNVRGMDSGLYKLNRNNLNLEKINISSSDHSKLLEAPLITSPFLQAIPQMIMYGVSNQESIERKYQNIALKLTLLNAGVLMNTLHLTASTYGVSSYLNGHNFESSLLEKYLKNSQHLMLDLIFP